MTVDFFKTWLDENALIIGTVLLVAFAVLLPVLIEWAERQRGEW